MDFNKNMKKLEENYIKTFKLDLENHDTNIAVYDAVEAMDSADTFDSVSKGTESKITDSATAVIYEERASRVVGQLPQGHTDAIGETSAGKAMLLDIIKDKWILPNANADFDLRTKLELWVENTSKYGKVAMYPDIVVDENGKTHLDCFLIHPRNFIPEKGKVSINSMSRCHLIMFKDKDWLESLLDLPDSAGWDKVAIKDAISMCDSRTNLDTDKRQSKSKQKSLDGNMPGIKVATTYESGKDGKWITFLPDYSNVVLRSVPNLHKNGRLPFIQKMNRPKIDNYYETSDYIRSIPMQALSDGLSNYYMKGIVRALYPPIAINGNTVVMQSVSNDPNSLWQFNGTPEFRTVEGSTAGLNTYSTVMGMTKGALNSLAGTTDTSITAESSANPAYGRTPQALKMIEQRESTGDAKSRKLLEAAFGELIEYWYTLLPLVEDSIPVELMEKEIMQLTETYPEFAEVMGKYIDENLITSKVSQPITSQEVRVDEDGNVVTDISGNPVYDSIEVETGDKSLMLKIRPELFKDLQISYNVVFNSSYKKTKESQLLGLEKFMDLLGKIPNVLQQHQLATGQVLNAPKILSKIAEHLEIDIADELFVDGPPPEQAPTNEPQINEMIGA